MRAQEASRALRRAETMALGTTTAIVQQRAHLAPQVPPGHLRAHLVRVAARGQAERAALLAPVALVARAGPEAPRSRANQPASTTRTGTRRAAPISTHAVSLKSAGHAISVRGHLGVWCSHLASRRFACPVVSLTIKRRASM